MVNKDTIYMRLVELLLKRFDLSTAEAAVKTANVMEKWQEPHRYFHTLEHLDYILSSIENLKDINQWDEFWVDSLTIAAYYHDIVYDPRSKFNEEQSAAFFMEHLGYIKGDEVERIVRTVYSIIIESDISKKPLTGISQAFRKLDTYSIYDASLVELIVYEDKIFKEYQFYSYDKYKEGRIKLLQELLRVAPNTTNHIYELIQYVQSRQPRIAVYPGSFNPFHVGHLAILKKAEQIFDKVIIAVAYNPGKENTTEDFINALQSTEATKYHEIVLVKGLLTDYISQVEQNGCNVTVVKGLRNGTDIDYEINQLRFMRDMKADYKVVYIACDIEHEHISSSAIRQLRSIDSIAVQKYIPK